MGRQIEGESTRQSSFSLSIGATWETKHRNLFLSVFTSISRPVSERLAASASSCLPASRCHQQESRTAAGGVAFTLSPRQHHWSLVGQQPRHSIGRKQQRWLLRWSCCRGKLHDDVPRWRRHEGINNLHRWHQTRVKLDSWFGVAVGRLRREGGVREALTAGVPPHCRIRNSKFNQSEEAFPWCRCCHSPVIEARCQSCGSVACSRRSSTGESVRDTVPPPSLTGRHHEALSWWRKSVCVCLRG